MEKTETILNRELVDVLENTAYSLKIKINQNSFQGAAIDEKSRRFYKFLNKNELEELIEIRNRIKELKTKLNKKLVQY